MNFRDILTDKVKEAFTIAGYDGENAYVSVSGRPDLCQYQCNASFTFCVKISLTFILITFL